MAAARRYALWRQDDNGNRFLVAVVPERQQAESRLKELTRVLHKQTYWVNETSETGEDDGTE